ncbi:MAG: hypothetical protein EG825_13210, partial [Rhodocyclaceae bacterium]|nr:hypothetical protein [Rhodocyclaceae bacterium]
MGFIPLSKTTDPGFPRVSPSEQAARDAVAETMVADELGTVDAGNPQAQAALEAEYRQRFNKPAPVKRGFIPLADVEGNQQRRGFVPLEQVEPEAPSILKTIALENPLTAAGEAALNLGSQAVALPVAGVSGLVAAAGKALGITERDPADVVHSVGGALTYQPRGEFGKGATAITAAPFEALAKVGTAAGDKTLDATDSPALATAVDTAINALPMALAPGLKKAKAVRENFSTRSKDHVQAET